MKLTPILLLLLFLASCATGPTVLIKADGSKTINLGASVFEDSKAELAMVKLPDGTEISYRKDGKSQTKIPLSAIRTYGTVASIEALWTGQNAQAAIEPAAEVQKAGIRAGVQKAKIQADVTKATFVPPETLPVAP